MSLEFALLDDSRLAEAFEVLQRVGQWVQSQGRRQRIAGISLEAYRDWQAERANYVVTEQDEIVGVVTLRRERLADWPDHQQLGEVLMLRALGTDPPHRGKGIGAYAVCEATMRCDPPEPVYLDCVSEFLPDYYRGLGFTTIARQKRTIPGDGIYDITLMRLSESLKHN